MGVFDFPPTPPPGPAPLAPIRPTSALKPFGAAPTPTPFGAPNAQSAAQACNCGVDDYEPSSPCYDQCGGGGKPPADDNKGSCPEGTPGGYAACCPDGPNGQRVWRPDTKTCEYEDDRQKRGEDTCRDNGGLPIKCPPGQESWCNFTTGTQQCASTGAGNGGGGGAGGGGGYGPGSPSTGYGYGDGSEVGADINAELKKYIRKLLKEPSRYTPQVLQALYGQIASQSSGQITRGEREVRADAARRGMSRAGSVAAGIRDVIGTAEGQRGQATVGVQVAKINADYQDKMGALDRAQKYLDSMRDNAYRYALLGEQRRQFDANLTLAYANLAHQKSLLQMNLQSQWDMLQSQQGFALVMAGT